MNEGNKYKERKQNGSFSSLSVCSGGAVVLVCVEVFVFG